MRVAVTGAGGMVGREVVERLSAAAHHDVEPLDHVALDVGDRDAVLQCLGARRLDAVINCAAFTAVDACETEVEQAFRGNAFAVRNLAEACTHNGAHLVTISTDYVFDGKKAEPYHEWDAPNPQSVYGASKLAGEREARAVLGPGCTVARTSWVCGRYGSNMVKTVLRLVGEDPTRTLRFVDDQRGCPTFADDLASMLCRLAVDRRPGVYHVTNQGPVSWFEFVQAIVRASGGDPARVEPIATADLHPPRPAPRPANSVLDNLALRLADVELLPHWDAALGRTLSALG